MYFVAWVPYWHASYKVPNLSLKYLVISHLLYRYVHVYGYSAVNLKTIDFSVLLSNICAFFFIVFRRVATWPMLTNYCLNLGSWCYKRKKMNKGPARPDPNTAVVNRRCARKKNIYSYLARLGEVAYLWILIKYFVRALGNELRVLKLNCFLVFEIKLESLCYRPSFCH